MALVVCLAVPSAGGQETRNIRVAFARAVEEAPVIDGRVDEDIWLQADIITDFVQSEPHEGEPAT